VDGNTPTPVVRRLSERVGDPDCLFVDGNVDGDIVICLMERLTATDIQNTGRLVEDLRLYKDRVEIEAMKRAARIADAASEEVRALGGDVIGMTERELAADVRSRLHAKGGERVSFPVTVAAGPNGARPTQYRHGDRKIRPGEPVVIDFGTFESGYASDQTRTSVFSGEPTERFREAYDAVIAGLEAGVEAAEPGVSVATVDAAVRSSIAEYGSKTGSSIRPATVSDSTRTNRRRWTGTTRRNYKTASSSASNRASTSTAISECESRT
jgi:Xaa-Pro aminopeptidase